MTQKLRFASAAEIGAQPTPFQSESMYPSDFSPVGQRARHPPVGNQTLLDLPSKLSGSTRRSCSASPTSFQVKSSGLPSKKGPSSWLMSDPRKPSERLAGLTARTRRSAGT